MKEEKTKKLRKHKKFDKVKFRKRLSNYLVTFVSIFTTMVVSYVSVSLFVFDQFNIYFYYLVLIAVVALIESLLIELFVRINKISVFGQMAVIYATCAISSFLMSFTIDSNKKNGISTDKILVKDGSGVSRNNLVSVGWITDSLVKLNKEKDFESFKEKMAQPGDGTLSNRLFDLRGDAWFKTGSLSNVSAISGFVKSQDGNDYVVAIIIQNFMEEQPKVKKFEDDIIKLIYSK